MGWSWPSDRESLIALQVELAAAAGPAGVAATGVPAALMAGDVLVGGCFVAFARGEAGPGRPGDRGWAGAVAWRARASARARSSDQALRHRPAVGEPRQASDVSGQSVAAGTVSAAYEPGLLALREGPLLASAATALRPVPDVLLVDATGRDHPRRAGLAVHLGAVVGLPTVGVTHRPLAAPGESPPAPWRRGALAPLRLDGEVVGWWVCTRTGVRPVLAHAGWLTDPETAAELVLLASTEGARTPVPLQEARRVAREARALAGAG